MKKPLILSATLLLTTGWGITPPSPSVQAQTPLVQNISESTDSVTEAQSTITLLDPGTQPRQVLQFRPVPNSKQTTVMTMNIDMRGTVNGQLMPNINMPAIKITVESEVTQVEANGDAHIRVGYTDINVVSDQNTPPELIEMLRSQMQQLKGLSITFVIDEQGISKDMNVSLPDNLDPNLQQFLQPMLNSLEQFSGTPFPEEPVGVGATWQLSLSVPMAGFPLQQLQILYEVEEIQDNQVTLKMSIQQDSNLQDLSQFKLPGAPPGVNVNIRALRMQSSGKMTIGLDRILPLAGRMSTLSNMDMVVTEPESQQETLMQMTSSVQMIIDSQ